MPEKIEKTFREKLRERLDRLNNPKWADKWADAVQRTGMKFYGAIGGEAAARDEGTAVNAAREKNWEQAVKSTFDVEADIARHLIGRDKDSKGR